jgi:hypothetical protein
LLVVVKVVLVEDLSRVPVAHDELHEVDRLALADVDVPLLEPLKR